MKPTVRLRLTLLFTVLGLGGLLGTALGLWLAHGRLEAGANPAPLIVAAVVTGFVLLGLILLAWLFCDEHIARPIASLAAALRTRAHGDVTAPLDLPPLRHLDDLGPAASAVCERLDRTRVEAETVVARATARLAEEKALLSAILSEIPIAVMAVGPTHRITLYDRQCVHLLGDVAPLGLDRSVFEYFDHDALTRAVARLTTLGAPYLDAELPTADKARALRARIRVIHRDGGYLLTMDTETDEIPERPLVFDFDLLDRPAARDTARTPLAHLAMVVFDTETTGLSPQRDEIVQIGAVRIVNGRRVEGEAFETLVNPGRPIPPVSTRVHGINDAAVREAPDIARAGRAFHRFAEGAVLVAHNAPFDVALLRRNEGVMGVRFDHPVLDTVLLSAAVFGEGVPHTLDAIAARLGVRIDPALRHTAMGDAVATAEVVLRLLPVLDAAGIRTFAEAVKAMRRHQRLLPDLNG